MIELVIFDYGGVISESLLRDFSDFERRRELPAGSVSRLLFGDRPANAGGGDPVDGSVDPDEISDFHRLETGELDFATYLNQVLAAAPGILGRDLEPADLEAFSGSTGPRIYWPIVHEIWRLRAQGLRLALLTNNVREFHDTWWDSFPVEECFDVVIDSSEVGMRKPDSRIYTLTCEQAGSKPTAAVFLDDNYDNIEAARALGIEVVHVGLDPLVAIAELQEILSRRGTKVKNR